MAMTHDAVQAASRSAFWNGFWDAFAAPIFLMADLILPRAPESPKDRVNRRLARYGLAPVAFDPDPGSVIGAWYAVGHDLRLAFAEWERDHGAKAQAAKIEVVNRPGDEAAGA